MMALNVGGFAGLGVGHVPKRPTGFVTGVSRNAPIEAFGAQPASSFSSIAAVLGPKTLTFEEAQL